MVRMLDASLDCVEVIKNAKPIDEDSKDMEFKSYDIRFKNGYFSYDKRVVLKDVIFDVLQNTTIAIVGPSGGGKSTICNLIARFYDVQQGTVSIKQYKVWKARGHNGRDRSCS